MTRAESSAAGSSPTVMRFVINDAVCATMASAPTPSDGAFAGQFACQVGRAHAAATAPRRPPTRAVLLLLATLLASGCAVTPPPGDPPAAWAPSRTAMPPEGCPDLTGAFANRPADVHPRSAAQPLALHEVFGLDGRGVGVFGVRDEERPWPALPDAATVTFKLDGDALGVRFRDAAAGEAVLALRRLSVNASERKWDAYFYCGETDLGPAAHFPGPRVPIGGVPGVYGELDLQVVSLFRGTDGALIVRHRTDRHRFTAPPHGAAGSQVRATGSTWWRYLPAGPAP